MPVKIRLKEGEELTVDVDAAEWEAAFQDALATGRTLQIVDSSRGRKLNLNPQSVAYWYLENLDQAEPPRLREAEPAAH